MKSLRNVVALMMISFFGMRGFAQSDVAGEWLTGKANTVVKIAPYQGVHYGKIISSENPRAKIGQLIVRGLNQKKGKWKGELYAPKRDDWYDAEFARKGNILIIKVSAGFFSKTVEWTQATTD